MRIPSTESLYVTPGERAGWTARVEQSDVLIGHEMCLRRRDGKAIWVRNSARALRDATGRMTHYEGALENIHEWKEAQKRLAAQHATTRVLADSPRLAVAAPLILRAICESLECEWGAIWLVDAEGGALELLDSWRAPMAELDAFEAATRAATFREGEGLPGQVWASGDCVAIRDVAEAVNFRRREAALRAGLHGAFAFPVRLDHETMGVVEILGREIRDGDAHLFMMARTIGGQLAEFVRRQRAEEALSESERALKSIFDSLDRVFWSMDVASGRVTHVSHACEAIYGLSRETFLQDPMAWRESVLPEDRAHVEAMIDRAKRGEPITMQYRIRRAHREERWLEVHMKRVDAPAGRSTLDGIVTDITERRLGEQRLRDALAKAQESDRLKSSFLANMSHEIRTPINVITGFLDVLQAGVPSADARQEYFEAISRASDRLINTVYGVLEVARLETSAFDYHPAPLRVARVLEERARHFEASIRRKGLDLKVEIDEPAAMIWFDEYCLSRVLDQLLDNALKFTATGRVTLRLRPDAEEGVALEVGDTGVGIDEAYLPRLFHPFSQEDSGYTRKFEGSGLGLALVKRFLDLGRARVSVESEKGKGTTFLLRFDRWTSAEAAHGRHPDPSGSERPARGH
jgi:PAS domain S-box-containing protein